MNTAYILIAFALMLMNIASFLHASIYKNTGAEVISFVGILISFIMIIVGVSVDA